MREELANLLWGFDKCLAYCCDACDSYNTCNGDQVLCHTNKALAIIQPLIEAARKEELERLQSEIQCIHNNLTIDARGDIEFRKMVLKSLRSE